MASLLTRQWLRAWRTYVTASALMHLGWEVLQLPLYTLWRTASSGSIAFAVIHCTFGDIIIASLALLCVLLVIGTPAWPNERFVPVSLAVVLIGAGYTVYSEWLNTVVRKSWAYSDLMPLVPPLGTGLSPLLQWLVIPVAAFAVVRRATVGGAAE